MKKLILLLSVLIIGSSCSNYKLTIRIDKLNKGEQSYSKKSLPNQYPNE